MIGPGSGWLKYARVTKQFEAFAKTDPTLPDSVEYSQPKESAFESWTLPI